MQTIFTYMQYPFARYALIVGVLVALCASLLGVTLVLKRFSFIGDGLSHVAFGAIAVASVLQLLLQKMQQAGVLPASGVSRFRISFTSVDFPVPLSPMRAIRSPPVTTMERSEKSCLFP